MSECTFFEPEHKGRAKIGMHLHVDDIAEWSRVLECQALILGHISRRTNISYARSRLNELLDEASKARTHLLMDHRACKERYDAQAQEAGVAPE